MAAISDELAAIAKFVADNKVYSLAAGALGAAIGAVFSGFVSAKYGEIFKIRDAQRIRREQWEDLLNSAYHEVGLDLISSALMTAPDQLKFYYKKMLAEPDYFPIWTSHPEELFVFENQIKKAAAILPEEIKTDYYRFYQSHLFAKQYLVDARSKDILNLPQPRRIRFLANLYDACFESMRDACLAARSFERFESSIGRHYFDLEWAKDRFGLRLPSYDLGHVTTRWLAYIQIDQEVRKEQQYCARLTARALRSWEKRRALPLSWP